MTKTTMEHCFTGRKPSVSFEFFPPKSDEMEQKLWHSIRQLESLSPRFVSVTYGAGGGTRERTHHTVKRIVQETSLKPAAHLTCVSASRQEVDDVARGYWEAGVRHIVALRGDPPQGAANYDPHPEGYRYSCDLVAGLKRIGDFEISVAAFPEKHPDSPSFDADMDYLKRKVDAGANRAITQYFFDVEHYFRLVERVRAAGITIPVVPGILPIGNVAQVKKFSAMCGASVPAWVEHLFEGLDEDPAMRNMVAVTVAAEQCRKLMEFGVEDLHFYTLNRADLTSAVCHTLGLRPQKQAAA
jgi:methylenetetrahydrofolate reductase (NADPH)